MHGLPSCPDGRAASMHAEMHGMAGGCKGHGGQPARHPCSRPGQRHHAQQYTPRELSTTTYCNTAILPLSVVQAPLNSPNRPWTSDQILLPPHWRGKAACRASDNSRRACISSTMHKAGEREGASSPGPGAYYTPQQMSRQPPR